jgi:hypothetical protein
MLRRHQEEAFNKDFIHATYLNLNLDGLATYAVRVDERNLFDKLAKMLPH